MKTFQQFQEDAGILSGLGSSIKKGLSSTASSISNSTPVRSISRGLSSLNKKATTIKHAVGIHDPKTSILQRGDQQRTAMQKLKGINPKNPSNMPVDDSQFDGRIMMPGGPNYKSKMPMPRYGSVPPKNFMGKPTKFSQLDV